MKLQQTGECFCGMYVSGFLSALTRNICGRQNVSVNVLEQVNVAFACMHANRTANFKTARKGLGRTLYWSFPGFRLYSNPIWRISSRTVANSRVPLSAFTKTCKTILENADRLWVIMQILNSC